MINCEWHETQSLNCILIISWFQILNQNEWTFNQFILFTCYKFWIFRIPISIGDVKRILFLFILYRRKRFLIIKQNEIRSIVAKFSWLSIAQSQFHFGSEIEKLIMKLSLLKWFNVAELETWMRTTGDWRSKNKIKIKTQNIFRL